MSSEAAREIVEFWLGRSIEGPEAAEERREFWYRGGDALDHEIRTRFGTHVERACEGGFEEWCASAEGALALIILLDQFTRSIYRATPGAYCGDARALCIASRAVESGIDRSLPVTGRLFLYHPFHHAESVEDQDRSIALVDAIRHDVQQQWHEYLDRRVEGFTKHRDIVARFGRFPHRNHIVQRPSTAEEEAFLNGEHETFGQG